MFLQLQKKLGDKIMLKGSAAAQFYIPVISQRASIDIDMICTATRDELHSALSAIEADLGGVGDFCKFKLHQPQEQWAIAGYQLGLLCEYIFCEDTKILRFDDISELTERIRFTGVQGP
jgi:hypothetical protein